MSIFERGKRYGLTRIQVKALYWITSWFNFYRIKVGDEERPSIGTDHEPDFETLCSNLDGDLGLTEYQLQSKGLIEERWIAGRPCSWCPTEQGLEAMEYIFEHRDDVYPPWAEKDQDGAPLFRDGSEKMLHRKGVCATDYLLNELGGRTKIYPNFPVPYTPDTTWVNESGEELAHVEVLSCHNDLESVKNKWLTWVHPDDPPVIWVVENREMMVRMRNHIQRNTGLDMDGGEFGGDANNWSPKRVNQRLRRTRRQQDDYNGIECCWTVGGVLRREPSDAVEFLDRNNIIN